jgi:L-alanine-DL-glutamate epimerase-like enolase superfamily enzyme
VNRRQLLRGAALAGPAAIDLVANTPQGDRPRGQGLPKKITGVEALYLEKQLTDRFWMSNSPIGGFNPKATRVVLKIHTDAGITGYGEGRAPGADVLRKGFTDLIMGEDPYMVGKLWERMFATTYGREPSLKGWSRGSTISAMSAIDTALYDIMAKAAGLPLFKFLGAYTNTVPVYVTGGYYRGGKGIP